MYVQMIIFSAMTIDINNRELVRNYKEWKEKLLNGEVDEIRISQKGKGFIKMTLENERSPIEELHEMVKKNPLPHIERPEEDLLELLS